MTTFQLWGKDLLVQVIQFQNGNCIAFVPNKDGINVMKCKVPQDVEATRKDFVEEALKSYDGSDKRNLIDERGTI